MRTNGRVALAATNSDAQEPTPASTWLAVAGTSITDEVLEWPADLFALTDVILESRAGRVARTRFRQTARIEYDSPRFTRDEVIQL
jgi:hypothetical protein